MSSRALTDFFQQKDDKKPEELQKDTISNSARQWRVPDYEFKSLEKLSKGYILSVFYEGNKRTAGVKLYEPETKRILFWYDSTGHLPYCISNRSINELKEIDELTSHPGFDHFESVKKYDLLKDTSIDVTKIVAKDPRSIGGNRRAIRDMIPEAWEARIRYYNCYIYDRELLVGMPYEVKDDRLFRITQDISKQSILELQQLFKQESPEFREYVDHWIELFQCPIPSLRRVAVDIEVHSSVSTRVPDAHEANDPIIAASMVDSEGIKRVLLLKREEIDDGNRSVTQDARVEYYDNENLIIEEILKVLLEYPIVLTFNGDDFDLRYIYNRAIKRGITRDKVPIIMSERSALLKYGIHVDLYKFFFNRSIQIYAFSQRYTELTLDSVAKALLGVGKLDIKNPISELAYSELVEYSLRDAEITYQLSAFDDELVMKLIQIMMRITKMPMEDLTRQGVSSWIRNLMYYEHRRLHYLIPKIEDILDAKGQATSTAIIKGKKFKGAIVVDPKPGLHFNVPVLDFASLYPSVIKIHNLSYETVLCPHEPCRSNQIPDLPHWVCKKKKGLSSLIIGSLRDVRVKLYKKMAKDQNIQVTLRNLYNVIQLTLKVLLNASYGVMGAESFNLYCPPLAEAVTAIGRYAITETTNKADTIGIDVLYGDTDSVFLKDPTSEQINELISWSEEELGMELEIDKVYRYAAFSHLKKNYFGVYPDGKVDIKGLTGKKRHIPDFLKTAFMEMVMALSTVQSPDDFEHAKTKIRGIVKTSYRNLKSKRYPLNDLALKIMVSKPLKRYTKTTPQHVKAANLLVQAGYEIKPGDIISFVKTTNDLGVKPVQLASMKEVDVDKYIEYLESTFEQVFDALGLEFQEIMGISKLETFFNF